MFSTDRAEWSRRQCRTLVGVDLCEGDEVSPESEKTLVLCSETPPRGCTVCDADAASHSERCRENSAFGIRRRSH